MTVRWTSPLRSPGISNTGRAALAPRGRRKWGSDSSVANSTHAICSRQIGRRASEMAERTPAPIPNIALVTLITDLLVTIAVREGSARVSASIGGARPTSLMPSLSRVRRPPPVATFSPRPRLAKPAAPRFPLARGREYLRRRGPGDAERTDAFTVVMGHGHLVEIAADLGTKYDQGGIRATCPNSTRSSCGDRALHGDTSDRRPVAFRLQ